MTKDEAYELMQKQNWYKLFIKEVQTNCRNEDFNKDFRQGIYFTSWIDQAIWWDATSQGHRYWKLINDMWESKTM
jgi:hypothetical protein